MEIMMLKLKLLAIGNFLIFLKYQLLQVNNNNKSQLSSVQKFLGDVNNGNKEVLDN